MLGATYYKFIYFLDKIAQNVWYIFENDLFLLSAFSETASINKRIEIKHF